MTATMHLTPVQEKIMALLSDGQPHTAEELHTCLVDDLGPVCNVYPHICYLRKKLNPEGQDIVSERHSSGSYYVLRRLLHSANDGKR